MNELPAAGVMRVIGPQSIGAGFLVTAGGLIVTCAHVLAGSAPGATVDVEPHTGRQPLKATVVLLENPPDVAVLQLAAEIPQEAAVLPLGRSPQDQDRRQGFAYLRLSAGAT